MPVNDIELNVGVNFNEDEFLNAYESALNKTSTATQQIVRNNIDSLSGSAAPDWTTLPYATMHSSSSGNRTASKAFLASLAHDLNAAGITSTSEGFTAALTNATYMSTIPDTTERFRRLRAEGLYEQAALTAPGSALVNAVESDYALMQQGWSRNFIELSKNAAGQQEAYINFGGMRDYAVDEGIGRWIDEDLPHTADNFELIDNELESIQEKSEKTKKEFTGWSDTLKGVLGVLTAIGALEYTVYKATQKAEQGVVTAGGSLSKQRAFIGMSALDEMRTKVASKSVGLGEDAIRDEIYSMSENIEQYKLMGQGDALPSALLGIFNNLMSADDPYDVYLKSADQIYKELKGMDKDQRRSWRMLMQKAGLGAMSDLVGQFISNPEYAQKYGTPSTLFSLENNPFYGGYGTAETLLPDLAKLKTSLQTSYNELYLTWEQTFGLKFTAWWDDVMKTKVVPWFKEILGYLSSDEQGGFKDDVSDATFQAQVKLLKTQIEIANAAYSIDSADAWTRSAEDIITAVGTGALVLPAGVEANTLWPFQASDKLREGVNSADPRKFWSFIETAAISGTGASSPYHTYGEDEKEFRNRAFHAKSWAEKQGYAADFERWVSLTDEQKQKLNAARAVMQAYMYTGNYDETLSKFGAQSFTESEGFKILAAFIAENKDVFRNDPEKIREIKIKLLDPYGRDLPIEVLEDIVGEGFKFTSGDRQ